MAKDTLEKQGRQRTTAQRALLLELIHKVEGHLDADELYQQAREKRPGLSLSTVYRSLRLFKELVASPAHEPGLLPAWLAEQGASAVIASGMGSRAQALFGENHIQVILGALEGDPEQIVLDYIQGTLATGDNLCDH